MHCRRVSREDAKVQRKTPRFSLRLLVFFCVFAWNSSLASSVSWQTKPFSEQAAATAMTALWRDTGYPPDGHTSTAWY